MGKNHQLPVVYYFDADDRKILSNYLHSLSRRPGYQGLESLGIFHDADQNAQSAFQSKVLNII